MSDIAFKVVGVVIIGICVVSQVVLVRSLAPKRRRWGKPPRTANPRRADGRCVITVPKAIIRLSDMPGDTDDERLAQAIAMRSWSLEAHPEVPVTLLVNGKDYTFTAPTKMPDHTRVEGS